MRRLSRVLHPAVLPEGALEEAETAIGLGKGQPPLASTCTPSPAGFFATTAADEAREREGAYNCADEQALVDQSSEFKQQPQQQ